MRFLTMTFGASVLACGSGPCAQTSFGIVQTPSGSANIANQFVGQGGSPFSVNKPWGSSIPTNWQNSPPSIWTSSQAQVQTSSQLPTSPRASNPSLAGRSPSEQLQITKCRSAQSCEKCRQLNCYWDNTAKITNRCIALGLEFTQVPVEAGQASNLGYCPTSGQQGYIGVNWLAIENSGAAVPNLEGMSDVNVQQWLSSIPNYNPDATDANYPAGDAFKELLPTAAKAYAEGKIPSTTPWISFFDSLNVGYSYDEYLDGGYTYDQPSTDYNVYGRLSSPNYLGSGLGTSSGSAWDSPYPSTSFGGFPATTGFPGALSSISSCCGQTNNFPLSAQFDNQFSNSPLSFAQQSGSSFFPSFGSSSLSQPLSFGTSLPSQLSSFGTPLTSQPVFGALPSQPVFGQIPFQSSLGPGWNGFS